VAVKERSVFWFHFLLQKIKKTTDGILPCFLFFQIDQTVLFFNIVMTSKAYRQPTTFPSRPGYFELLFWLVQLFFFLFYSFPLPPLFFLRHQVIRGSLSIPSSPAKKRSYFLSPLLDVISFLVPFSLLSVLALV